MIFECYLHQISSVKYSEELYLNTDINIHNYWIYYDQYGQNKIY